MYQILIVEDEALIRKSMAQGVCWEQLGAQLAAEAENGEEAIEILKNNKIDIVITDMKMPKCDGAEMLKRIESMQIDCEIIVLSEYTDFAYMHQAIHAHVFDYLLKPISIEQLNNILSQAIQRCERKQALNGLQSDKLSLLYREVIRSSVKSISNELRDYFSNDSFFVACIMAKNATECSEVQAQLEELLKMSPFETRVFPFDSNDHMAFMLTELKSPVKQNDTKKYNEWIKKSFSSYLIKQNIRVGLSNCHTLSEIGKSFSEAQISIQFICENEIILDYTLIQPYIDIRYSSPVSEDKAVEIITNNAQGEAELYQIILNTVIKNRYIYISAVRLLLIDFTMSLERGCQKNKYYVDISRLLGKSYIDIINSINWLTDVKEYLKNVVHSVSNEITLLQSLSTKKILETIVDTVNTQYMNELSLMEFSQKYHINYIYLSRSFKKLTGTTFTDYLMSVRMEKARELIENEGLSEKTVAPLVGYSNPYYFISSFRKYYNNTEVE